jgi:hypothetical protein
MPSNCLGLEIKAHILPKTAIYTSRLTISNSAFCIYGFCMILIVNSIISLNRVNKLMCVMVMGRIVFEVQPEFLNII